MYVMYRFALAADSYGIAAGLGSTQHKLNPGKLCMYVYTYRCLLCELLSQTQTGEAEPKEDVCALDAVAMYAQLH